MPDAANPNVYTTKEPRMHDHHPDASSITPSAALRDHYARVVLPVWRGPGFNAALGLAYEAVSPDHHAPLPVSRYRAMACARQLFVFANSGELAHAETLFASLRHYFQDKENGGWFYSVDANGAPFERQKDLYTHAFVIFACAEYAQRSGSADAIAIVNDTSALVEQRFAAGRGGLNAVLSEDFGGVLETPLQNPLMHLTEAWLAARDATGDSAFDVRLEALARDIARNFVHRESGCIAELPLGSAGNRLEPGHQFEWFFLVEGSRHPAFDAAGLREPLTRAFDFARTYGVDAATGGVAAALDESGRVLDATQRIWAQTEYLRALATHDSDTVRAELPLQIERFRQRFLHARGWIECQSAEGVVTRADMPSTTPYHLATAYASLPA
jgi:mannose/cellobiose epimerase-like protein (N-acyl-D-glucosamine 2-epimerase family)